MAYIGKTPVLGNFVKLDAISVVNGQAAYTMQNGGVNFTSYDNVNQFLVSLNGILQSPTDSFTVSGSTLTFASNLSTGDVIDFVMVLGNTLDIGTPSDNTVSTAKLQDNAINSAKISNDAVTPPKTNFFNTDPGNAADLGYLHVKTADSGGSANADASQLVLEGNTNAGLTILGGTGNACRIHFGDSGDNDIGFINYAHDDNALLFGTNAGVRMTIDSSGNLLIGKSSLTLGNTGCQFEGSGGAAFTRSAEEPLYVIRMTNDGKLVSLRQDNTEEGSITVSGNTVSYNGFTGTHWSRFQDNSTPTILRGTVLESLDEMCDWYNLEFDVITQDEDGNDVTTPQKIPHVLADGQSNGDVITYNYEGTDYQATIVKEADIKHMKSKVSDTVDAKNVYGIFVAYDEDGEGYNDFYVASVGSFVVRIKANETIAKGDLLQSNGDGTAKVQTDDAVRSSSFAKVLSTTVIETYDDGSFIVPCSLMC